MISPDEQARRNDQFDELVEAARGLKNTLPTRDFDEYMEGLWGVVGLHLEQQHVEQAKPEGAG